MIFRGDGQASVELIVILAISAVVLMFVLASSEERLATDQNQLEEAQISAGLKKVSDAADFVYSQSIGASMEMSLTIPKSVVSLIVSAHCFEYSLMRPSGELSESVKCSLARLNGTIDDSPGTKRIVLINQGAFVSVS